MALHERADGLVVVNDSLQRQPRLDGRPPSTRWPRSASAAAAVRSRCSARCSSSATPSAEQHAEVGRARRRASAIDVVVTVGDGGRRRSRDGARRTPGWSGQAVPTAGREQATDWLRHNVGARDVVLVKASRGAALEHLADALADPAAGNGPSTAEEQEGGTPSR